MNLAEHYNEVNVRTAGRLKSHQLLLERSSFLCKQVAEGEVPLSQNKIKIQNIISQLQASLNIGMSTARELHKVFSILWDTLDTNDEEAVFYVKDILDTHLHTIKVLQGLEKVDIEKSDDSK